MQGASHHTASLSASLPPSPHMSDCLSVYLNISLCLHPRLYPRRGLSECRRAQLKDDRSPPDISDVTFCVFNRYAGRMKRCVKYNIDMNWKLDPLRLMDFPFDVQDLTV